MTFLTVGAIMGAGFISGRELISFFGVGNFLPYLFLSCALLCLLFILLYNLGGRFSTVKTLNQNVLKNPQTFTVAIFIASFISVSGLLSGLDNIFYSLTLIRFPFLSVIILIIVCFSSKYGIKGVEKLSLIFIPIVLILVNLLILKNGRLKYNIDSVNLIKGGAGCLAFAMMNVFINLPPIVETASGKDKKTFIPSAIISSVIIFIQSALIITAIYGSGSFSAEMPLFIAVKGGGITLFLVVILSSMFTSVCSAFYPLYNLAKEKFSGYGVALTAIGAFCFSRLGLTKIVNYAYPIIAVFGGIYVIACLTYMIKKRYKKHTFADNKNKLFIISEAKSWQRKRR